MNAGDQGDQLNQDRVCIGISNIQKPSGEGTYLVKSRAKPKGGKDCTCVYRHLKTLPLVGFSSAPKRYSIEAAAACLSTQFLVLCSADTFLWEQH